MKPVKNYKPLEIIQTICPIVSIIFNSTFEKKFNAYNQKYYNDVPVLASAATDTPKLDVLIGELLFNRNNEKLLCSIIESSSDRAIYGIYFRYNWIVKHLRSLDKNEELTFPIDENALFLELMINYWVDLCLN